MMFTTPEAENTEIPAWKALDTVVRQWAVLSGFEKDQAFYDKLRQISQITRPKWQD